MRDRIEFLAMKKCSNGIVVAQIDLKNRGAFLKVSDIRALNLRVIEIVEVVEDYRLVAFGL